MHTKLSKLQKLILIYIGVTTKQNEKKFMNRRDVTKGIEKLLMNKILTNSFSSSLSRSITSLTERRLLSKRGNTIGLTSEGREIARKIIDDLEKTYGEIDWNVIMFEYCHQI